ncbi:MAG: cation:proton antiporter [Rhodospirillaceae bacterium]|nr:cation:proton antiporter [Rhodospirillaceae bacterium]
MELLIKAAIFFAAAVIVVPVFKRLGLGSVLGYLAAGAAIGPTGLALISDVESIAHVAEFGVVLLMFVIGLEVQPQRLWTARGRVFGLGGLQVMLTGALIAGMVYLAGLSVGTAAVVGLGLALSSTAFALQTLAERNELSTRHGRAAFAILLFQDVATIPILSMIPLLGGASLESEAPVWLSVLRVIGVVAAVIVGGQFLLRPVLRGMASTRIPELFTATALLIVTATALLMNWVGVSMALGAFLAGMLLANSEYRHELEADIEPFKGLLLGLFFISVGMGLNLRLLVDAPFSIAGLVAALLAVKFAALYALGRLWGLGKAASKDLGVSIAQGGEFAFVIFGAAVAAGLMSTGQNELLVLVVSLSMAVSPLLSIINDKLTEKFMPKKPKPFETMPDEENPVIIAGFGRFGQITGRVLAARKIPFTALDASPEQVDFVKRFGNKVYYGDASRLDLLRAARADAARIFVLAIDDVEASVRTAQTVRRHFPHLKVYARARNRQHAYRLMDLGVTLIQRETFLSALDLTRDVLLGLDISRADADRTVRLFRDHDVNRLFEHYNHYTDQQKIEALAKAGIKELEEMFERDAEEQARQSSELHTTG